MSGKVIALRKVLSELFISSTNGSLIGYLRDPHSTECSRMWATPVEIGGRRREGDAEHLVLVTVDERDQLGPGLDVTIMARGRVDLRELSFANEIEAVAHGRRGRGHQGLSKQFWGNRAILGKIMAKRCFEKNLAALLEGTDAHDLSLPATVSTPDGSIARFQP